MGQKRIPEKNPAFKEKIQRMFMKETDGQSREQRKGKAVTRGQESGRVSRICDGQQGQMQCRCSVRKRLENIYWVWEGGNRWAI